MYDRCIYFNLATLTRKINRIWSDAFGRVGLSPSHGYLLGAIAESPEASQKDLGALMELDASTITRFMDALEAKGLIEKTSRGKGASFVVTREGRKAHRAVNKTMDELYHDMQAHFGATRFKILVEGLREARQSFEETTP